MGELMQKDEHESIDRLLPWFVNGTLEPDEHDRVRRHVDGCETCRETVSLWTAVQSTVRHAAATPMVPPPRTERLLEAIERSDPGSKRPRALTVMALAASLAAAVLAVALLLPDRQNTETQPAIFETATSTPRRAPMDYVFEVRLEPGTPPATRDRVWRGLGARDIREIEPNEAYRITVSLPAASLEELEDHVRGIEALPEVESAAVVALQLPVTRPQ